MSLLRDVVASLEAEAIPHALIGAAAMAVHGVSRSTADVDLLAVEIRVLKRERWTGFEQRASASPTARASSTSWSAVTPGSAS